ncbi:TPM domain-containing protein [Comamonas sp. NLF-1-9]|uniref:TPM domain-containing protein n=1 Tax=Comamonas sp. NLF-1-9 TaxID=2853163 RepID=UPI002104E567|nr:TPM domain-containing protein [Comamonas sp. NLF-1-9]
MWTLLRRWLRHVWMNARGARQALPAAVLERLRQKVAASEARHTGQLRVCVEAALPGADLWRHLLHRRALAQVVRGRALTVFSLLRVWDTERNNGVLIYLLLAERAIEIVADRALARVVPQAQWDAMLARLATALQAGQVEDGLGAALAEVSALLEQHFPRSGPGPAGVDNELPDEPALL